MIKVISAFPACGKSTFYENYSSYPVKRPNNNDVLFNLRIDKPRYRILDSDSSEFSWMYDVNGNKTDVRNPDFPGNYIRHIKESINYNALIFVSSHKEVRDQLRENGIPYILVYPKKEDRDHWMERFTKRGNDSNFIEFQNKNWDNFIQDMDDEPFSVKVRLGISEYIDLRFIDNLYKEYGTIQMPKM